MGKIRLQIQEKEERTWNCSWANVKLLKFHGKIFEEKRGKKECFEEKLWESSSWRKCKGKIWMVDLLCSCYMAYYFTMKTKVAGSYETWYLSESIYIITSWKTVMLRKVVSLSHKRIISIFTSMRTKNPTLSWAAVTDYW